MVVYPASGYFSFFFFFLPSFFLKWCEVGRFETDLSLFKVFLPFFFFERQRLVAFVYFLPRDFATEEWD